MPAQWTDDVSLGDHNAVRHLQHRAYFSGGIHAGNGIYDADGGNPVDVGRATVAQPRAFGDEPLQALSFSPCHCVLNIADEVVIGAGGAGKARNHRHPCFAVAQVVEGGQAVEFNHARRPLRRTQRRNKL